MDKFSVGDYVFAKLRGYQPWPARITLIHKKKCEVVFYGTGETANVKLEDCFHYAATKDQYINEKSKRISFQTAVEEIELAMTTGEDVDLSDFETSKPEDETEDTIEVATTTSEPLPNTTSATSDEPEREIKLKRCFHEDCEEGLIHVHEKRMKISDKGEVQVHLNERVQVYENEIQVNTNDELVPVSGLVQVNDVGGSNNPIWLPIKSPIEFKNFDRLILDKNEFDRLETLYININENEEKHYFNRLTDASFGDDFFLRNIFFARNFKKEREDENWIVFENSKLYECMAQCVTKKLKLESKSDTQIKKKFQVNFERIRRRIRARMNTAISTKQ